MATLTAAEEIGSDVVRKVFRQLLLRWHPDKAAPAQKSEANRVMLFLLDQRSKLGLL